MEKFKQSSAFTKIALLVVITIWLVAALAVTIGIILFQERSTGALVSIPDTGGPTIRLEPAGGPLYTPVTIQGQSWPANRMVLVYLVGPEQNGIPPFATINALADANGQFTATFVVPADPRWGRSGPVKIMARSTEPDLVAQTLFILVDVPDWPAETPVIPNEPTVTPTLVIQPSPPEPGEPRLTSMTNLNIRGGPGTQYPVLGIMTAGQSAEITGLSTDGVWWQIKFEGTVPERGWVNAAYVTAQNTASIPVVQAPPLQAPTPAPVIINDWRGEYYNNSTLSGRPDLVRNDVSVNFDWGFGAPAKEIRVDEFSARWSRNISFPAGTYRFYAQADDGVRLWIDDKLIIDQWYDNSPTTHSADLSLAEGWHGVKVEYYERSGGALIQLAWERLEAYPDWKGEYFSNPNLSGAPVLVRNDPVLQFSWGPGSPGPGVPIDNFSARWSRSRNFSAGTYRFKVLVDDGARLWVDGRLIIDRWRAGDPASYTADLFLTDGVHSLRLEYVEVRYDAQVRLDWERVPDNYPDWKAEYYDNRQLQGSPVLVRNESKIDHKWGSGSPATTVPADNFSARWTRTTQFQAGTYSFQVKVDDGVRLWLDDTLLLDSWVDGGVRTVETERQIGQGQHRLKVEYYERGGEARIEVRWQKKTAPTNQLPQAIPGGPYNVDEGKPVSLDGRASRDPDGTIIKYEWNFNYNGSSFQVDATGPMASTRYPDGPATMIVALRVTDNEGASQLATTRVTVQNVAPSAEAGGPYTGPAGSLITLAGTASDPGQIDQVGLFYRWEFGDGSTGDGPLVSHSYTQAGTYTAKLTVTDKDGGRGTDTATVQVAAPNKAPRAVIDGPAGGLVGETLNFSGNRSSDPDGQIISYAWAFGDGISASGPNVSHRYNALGSYRLILTVTDNSGLTGSASLLVEIDEIIQIKLPPNAVIEGPATAQVGQVIQFNGAGSNDPDGRIISYAWDFGDGTSGSGDSVSHSFSAGGIYTVSLLVTDNDGLLGDATLTIQVDEAS